MLLSIMYRPLTRLLVRAPLLPLSSLSSPSPPAEPLFREAVASLPPSAERAISRYARRAAFRATPHGLLAGVFVGSIGDRTRVASGTPRAHRFASWASARAAALASLDDAAVRNKSRLRAAPTAVADEHQVRWLALGASAQAMWREAPLDEMLARVLKTARKWTPWPRLRAPDDYLMMLLEDGLLVSDREPPLVGPPPPGPPDAAMLLFDGAASISREAIARAARLAPLLFRLQHALSPPVAERDLQSPAPLESISEVFGAGALDLDALLLGEYGVSFDDEGVRQIAAAAPQALLELLLSRAHLDEAHFSVEELDRVLPRVDPPPTCELFLQPTRDDSGRGWLLGLHAPAGATFGRFAHALPSLLDELAAAEPPGRLDVAFAPSASLADLCAHPPLRDRALALIGWPERALALADLSLASPAPFMLHCNKNRVDPSPLFRVRSTTAPPGLARLLVGWSLHRQHAPWAMPLGILAALPRTPRVVIDGFVVSPRSWRLPSRELPPRVQIGHEDELLLVAHDELEESDRAWEVWPPLDEVVDAGGRRVEIVAALVEDSPAPALEAPGRVPPPRRATPAREWRSFKIFGAADRADAVLAGAVAPLAAALRVPWFFLRYVEEDRPHLRLRFRSRARGLIDRVEAALAPARAAGDVVSVEIGDYFREQARYGRALDAAERVFQRDSELVLALLAGEGELDALERCVLSLDALAAGLGLALGARRELASERRAAYQPELPDPRALADEYRARQSRLMALLASPPNYFAVHKKSLRKQARARPALPALLHLACNRMAPDEEARAFYFWDRALEGLWHRR